MKSESKFHTVNRIIETLMLDYYFRSELVTALNAGSPTTFLFRFDITSKNGSHARSTDTNVICKAAN